jgi:hypothetical protein
MVVEVVISSGRPTGTAEAVRLFGERLHLAPQDVLFVFHEVEPNLPRFPAASIRREATGPNIGFPPAQAQIACSTTI